MRNNSQDYKIQEILLPLHGNEVYGVYHIQRKTFDAGGRPVWVSLNARLYKTYEEAAKEIERRSGTEITIRG